MNIIKNQQTLFSDENNKGQGTILRPLYLSKTLQCKERILDFNNLGQKMLFVTVGVYYLIIDHFNVCGFSF